MGRKEALKLTAGMDDIYVSKGSKMLHFNLKRDETDEDELVESILGPTGNLRAPTIKVGRTLVVGFDEKTYEKVLLSSDSIK